MKERNKLLTYFSAFSKKDWIQFDFFINSPFFNTAPAYNRLFEYFNKNRSEENPDKLWKQQVFSYVYPGVVFKDGQLRTLFWRMCKLVETYLAVSNLTSDGEAMEDQLIMALGKRNDWFSLFEKRVKAKTKKDQQKHIDFTTLIQSIKLHHQLYYHEDFGKYRSGQLEISRLIEDLDQFIALAKLKYHCELLSQKQILKEEKGQSLLPDIVLDQILNSVELQNKEPVLFIYAKLIRMKQTGNLILYYETKEYFQEFQTQINLEDRQNILFFLINFIIYINKRKERSLYLENLELYQIGLESDMLIIHNRITYETYTNIAVLGSSQKKFVWTDGFIRKYQELLEPAKAGLAVKLARAYWNFHQGEYEKVLDWTNKIDTLEGQPDYPFRLRALKLRAFFELYKQDKTYRRLLFNFIESFLKFIKNNRKLAPQQAIAYLNFVRMIKMVLKKQRSEEFKEEQQQKLINSVTTTNPLVLKNWLLEKIKEK